MATSPYTHGDDPVREAIVYFQRITYPLLFLFGIVGNTLSFFVMNLPSNRSNVMCAYLKVLAISDTIALLFSLLPRFLINILPNILHLRIIGNLQCVSIFTIAAISFNISLWQVLIVAVDRLIAVTLPLKATFWCTMKKARILMTLNFAFHIVVYLPNVFRSSFLDERGYQRDCVLPETLAGYDLGANIINAVADVIIPLGSLFIVNIVIIVSLRKQSTEIQGMSRESGARTKQERSMTIMLIVIITTLLFLMLPSTLDFILWQCCLVPHPAALALS
jgi:hypothetical protein